MVVFSQCMDCKNYIGKRGMLSVARHFRKAYQVIYFGIKNIILSI